jgi:YgiT-type zinc finger domain-containing protein
VSVEREAAGEGVSVEREAAGEQPMRQAAQELQDWRAEHPRATFRELEEAVEAQLQRVRAALLAELAHDTAVPRPAHCPACGGRLRNAGERERTVALPGGAAVRLRRPYLHCPACGAGLFPPG